MGELTTGVSWLAVIVGAVASFLLGWLWYMQNYSGGNGQKVSAWNWERLPECRWGPWSPNSSVCF